MVAVIKTGSSIRRIFLYNENKVEIGAATCLAAINYPMDAHEMTSAMRLNRLMQQAALNSKVTRNSVHISLNFDPTDKDLSDGRLIEMAKVYMQGIGFSDQPFLIYRHLDAAHPHIHLVSTKVRSDGRRIDMHNIGRNASEKVRCVIEQQFNLVNAKDHRLKIAHMPKAVEVARVQYGQIETRGAIQNVLEEVLNSYNFTSLSQLNAVLRQFNVMADRGSERSRIFRNNGLLFRILNEHGQAVGVPIKASAFYNRPTLAKLNLLFAQNQVDRKQLKARTIHAIDKALQGNVKDMEELKIRLQQQAIHLVLRENSDGLIYGLSYVDHKNRCVFNGSELGKMYSAKGILAKFHVPTVKVQNLSLNHKAYKLIKIDRMTTKGFTVGDKMINHFSVLSLARNPLEILQHTQSPADYIPYGFKKRKKKRKQRISN
ncbi:relaxase/mobilization nuclease domain-containing protein [Sphingobacterium sp. HJSM2_6]|uniref:relaxase/mobilization nuclease domain-containing protein n=1 Tax=Sphingobacterium sp. HJSM2_6 TaxID=3366264 RepID=UPI003BBC8A76